MNGLIEIIKKDILQKLNVLLFTVHFQFCPASSSIKCRAALPERPLLLRA